MQKKILVVYYSDGGHTRKVAEYIANASNGKLEIVETAAFGKGFWAYMKRGWYALRKTIVPINPVTYDPMQFDLVIIGAPVWAGHVASPIRSYLAEFAGKLPEVAFFVTMGGSGGKNSLRDMREISGMEPIAELEISESDLKSKQDISKMNVFISRFGSLPSPVRKVAESR